VTEELRFIRIPTIPIALTLLLLVSALFAVPAVRDAATLAPLPQVTLERSAEYIVLGPVSALLDTLTLLTVPQHIALGVWVIVLFVAQRVVAARSARTSATRATRALREGISTAVFLLSLFVVYAALALMPRPMARLTMLEPDLLSVDFHLHTRYSHDGRSGWTAERARACHFDCHIFAHCDNIKIH
jgi:hypothetical protein